MENNADIAGSREAGQRGAQRPSGYRWLMCHATELPVSPAVLNSGLPGMVALLAAVTWYAVLHSPAVAGRLLPQ